MSLESQEVQIWLAKATRGLPREARRQVQAELLGHYLDTLDGFLQQGYSSTEAHQSAMGRLGDAELTCSEWPQVYPTRRRYLVAILASQVFSGLIILRALLLPILTARELVGFFAFWLMLTQPLVLLYLMKTLQRDHPKPYVLDGSLKLLTYGIVLWVMIFLVNGTLEDVSLPDSIVLLLHVGVMSALALVVVGLIRFSFDLSLANYTRRRAQKVVQSLSGLGAALLGLILLAVVLLQSGFVVARPWLANWLQNGINMVGLTEIVVYTVLCTCLTWVFCRAVLSARDGALLLPRGL